ncbi:IS110 family transposase [Streptomyces lunaelactis]|uniref:IS110 family transposase n=1 Tax=Streptomyces lunaelactis TaxID=1535768 RepID=UPI001C301A1F|nr:IS110 family transposase [Streptomyces lunaelactis]
MFSERTSVGLDVHARTTMAWALDGETGEVFSERLDAETHKVLAWVATLPQPAAVAYEAGPTGFVLARALDSIGLRCVVAAPSKMERPAGDRIKTDKRDAQRLAKLLRMDELPVVRVPTLAEEAARDLVRGRDDVRRDLARARNRISKLLLRQGRVWRGGSGWTYIHHEWLRKQRFDDADTEFAYDNGYEEVLALETMRDRFDQRITDAAARPEWCPVVRRLSCLRGIDTLSALGLAVEVGDWQRFTGATIGAYLGLVPSEHSSGPNRFQGPITKTGNSQARRLLVEASWYHYKPLPRSRRDPAPPDGTGLPAGTATGRPRQPAAPPAVGILPRPEEEHQRRRRRGGPRTRGLVLEFGGDGLTLRGPQNGRREAGRASARDDARGPYEHPLRRATLDCRPEAPSPTNIRSCGNQPADIGLTARRRTTRHRPPAGPTEPPPGPHRRAHTLLPT